MEIPTLSPTKIPPPPPLQKRTLANVLGPLTTAWTQPTTCTYLLQPRPTLTEFFRNQECILPTPDALNPNATGIPQDIPSCWPPTTSNAPVPTHPFFGWGIYSPAYICPSGYVTACSAEYGRRSKGGGWSTARMQYDIEPGETVLGCCPTGYTCGDAAGVGTCTLVVPSTLTGSERVTIPTAVCDGSNMVGTQVMATFPDVIPTSEVVAVTTQTLTLVGTSVEEVVSSPTLSGSLTRQVTLYAPLFHLYFQETDLPNGGLSQLSSTTGGPGDGSVVPTQSSGSKSGSEEKDSSTTGGGLSTGGTAGIAVGVVLAVVLLLGLGFCLFMRRRKRRREAGGVDGNGPWATKSELPGHGLGNKIQEAPSSYTYTDGSGSSPADSSAQHNQGLYPAVPPSELAANGEGVTPVEMYVPGIEEKATSTTAVVDSKDPHAVARYS